MPPKEDAVLFVAHPDDDTLFFHSFIKENKPYVVLLTTGWSLRRIPGFFKAMKFYGVRFRVYDMDSSDTRLTLLSKRVRKLLSMGVFEKCATHNAEGEYGHDMHKRIHDAVLAVSLIPVWVPVSKYSLINYPLDNNSIEEKRSIFNSFYSTEKWVIEQYSLWMNNEKLEIVIE